VGAFRPGQARYLEFHRDVILQGWWKFYGHKIDYSQ
jgi:hypothetical protein